MAVYATQQKPLKLDPETAHSVAERARAQRAHLALRGLMAAEIAHDINNYLAVLGGNAELMGMRLGPNLDDGVRKCLDNIRRVLTDLEQFSSNLLTARRQSDEPDRVDINSFVSTQIGFLKPQKWLKRAVVETELSEHSPIVMCASSDLQIVLYNLLRNASEALEESRTEHGTVWVRTSVTNNRRNVSLSIGDNAGGIPQDFRSKLFKERTSTKGNERGFGLLIVAELVTAMNGIVHAGPGSPTGTEMTIEIPVAPVSPTSRPQINIEAFSA